MRVSEQVVAAFFAWTTLLALVLPVSGHMRMRALAANAGIMLVYLFLKLMRRHHWAQTARDWVPQALMILAYKEMGWFAPATHTYRFEHQWIVWDRMLLDEMRGRALIEATGYFLPAILEFTYVLVYAVPPITMVVAYATNLRKRADTLLTIYLLGLFLCYAQFPFWPSEPPRAVFPGQDLPNIVTPLRAFNLFLVGNYGIHTSVFPSAHVSGAFAAAFAILYLMPQRRTLVVTYFVYATLVAVATVYGRYHYAIDALGGFGIGLLAFPLGVWLVKKDEQRQARAVASAATTASV